MTQVTRVPFHGTSILTNPDGTQIVVRPVCDALGLDADAQGWSYEPDPDEAYDRMMDDCMEREAEETWH